MPVTSSVRALPGCREHTERICDSKRGLFLEVWENDGVKYNSMYGDMPGLETFQNCYQP